MSSIFDFTVKDSDNNDVTIPTGSKAYLIVNVASSCGYTASNYKELEQIQSKYASRGLSIIAFPCNDFGGQEPGTMEQICAFAKSKRATFPLYGKLTMLSPIYQYLTGFSGNGVKSGPVTWNFTKFLCNKDGIPVKRYSPATGPLSFESDIAALLE
jgi:glutathione peroxidase